LKNGYFMFHEWNPCLHASPFFWLRMLL
jgi:hypothetical protein